MNALEDLDSFLNSRSLEVIGQFYWRSGYDDHDPATDEDVLEFFKLLANVLNEKGLVTTGSVPVINKGTTREVIIIR